MTVLARSGIAMRSANTAVATLRQQHVIASRLLLFLAIFFGLGLARSGFQAETAAWSLLQGSTTICLLGMGIATTMVAGELDLSVAAVAGLSAVATVKLLDHGVLVAVTGSLALALGIGLIQGLGVAFLPIKSIVLTFGTMVALDGVQSIVTSDGKTAVSSNFAIVQVVGQRLWIFTPLSLGMLIVVVVYQLLLVYSRFGTRLNAFGAARKESLLAGVRATPVTVAVFAISSTLAGAAGAASALTSASAVPQGLDPLLLSAVAVALIGGISLYGGRGGPVNVLLGAVLVVGLSNELSARGVSAETANLATAGLLLLAVLVEILGSRNSRARATLMVKKGSPWTRTASK
jgi:ribose/xylose/arabinose/galactoside ABC-type transport system permease subunit